MQQVTVEQRRRHLARRQHLARPAEDVHEVARDLCGLHSSDAASVLLAARARVRDFVPADAEVALYDDRSLARVLGMRRTMFVVPTEDVALVHAAATADLLGRETRRLVGMLADSDVTDGADPAAWLARVSDATVEALHDLGPATATELTAVVPELGRKVTIAPETRWGGQFGVSTRVLFLLATEGRIVRGRPRGSWLSTQYRWAATDTWFDGRVDLDAWEPADAHVELARRWLRAFGPATADDLRWWAGWTKGRTRTALAALRPTEVDLGGTPGLLAPGDELDDGPVDPWVALLPSLDSTIMGWTDRDHVLDPELRPVLFDRNGNAGPTVWADGRVVGGWAQHPDGEVVTRLLVDVGRDVAAAVEAEAAALTGWLGDIRVTARFRTPLEKELSA